MKKILLIVTVVFSMLQGAAFAGIVSTSHITINRIDTYSAYGGGDVIIYGATGVSGCNDGLWMKKTDPGFQANMAIVMTAFLYDKTLIAYINNDGIVNSGLWSGGSIVCLVDSLRLDK